MFVNELSRCRTIVSLCVNSICVSFDIRPTNKLKPHLKECVLADSFESANRFTIVIVIGTQQVEGCGNHRYIFTVSFIYIYSFLLDRLYSLLQIGLLTMMTMM